MLKDQLLEIFTYPNKALSYKAELVLIEDIKTPKVQDTISRMLYTCQCAHGMGLAAIQVGVKHDIIIVTVEGSLVPMINADFTPLDQAAQTKSMEGCLSIPQLSAKAHPAQRWDAILVNYYDQAGIQHIKEFKGLEAACIQHEVDHNIGNLFVETMKPRHFQKIKKKLNKKVTR